MMIPCIAAVLTRFKTDWAAQLHPDAIKAACQEAGYTAWRERVLTPVTTIQLFLLQMLHGNTACSICRTCRAYGSARRPTAKPARNSPSPSSDSC